ncbi:MAG: hypothetical protein OXC40_05880 [Proteobacteria bacterium]|nr:hypothetical protein [Pseudomonadota bacterium]
MTLPPFREAVLNFAIHLGAFIVFVAALQYLAILRAKNRILTKLFYCSINHNNQMAPENNKHDISVELIDPLQLLSVALSARTINNHPNSHAFLSWWQLVSLTLRPQLAPISFNQLTGELSSILPWISELSLEKVGKHNKIIRPASNTYRAIKLVLNKKLTADEQKKKEQKLSHILGTTVSIQNSFQ